VVEGDVEKSLDLPRVEVHGDDAVHARRLDEVSHELCRDGRSRRDLAVLPRVSVVGDDGGDGARRGPAQRVGHDEQLHHVVVRRNAGGLNHEGVDAANVLADLDEALAVAEARDLTLPEGRLQILRDIGG
jgi:hypothetical protein